MFNIAAMDISTDLTELGRTPVTVISAGIKSILDIGRTLEYLVRVCYVDTFNIISCGQLYASLFTINRSK